MATKLPNGRYRSQVLVGIDAAGKRQYRSFTADTADEADFLALQFKLKKDKHTITDQTVRECVNNYIDVRENLLSPTTIEGYRNKARNTFQSVMGMKVTSLTNAILQTAAYADLRTRSVKTVKEGFA